MMRSILLLVLLVAWPLQSRAAPLPEVVSVPYTDEFGVAHRLYANLCRPEPGRDARVVVFAHGAPPDASVRPRMQPLSCGVEAAQWFVRRGYIVIAAMRLGYGPTGGPYPESAGRCSAEEYVRSGRETARQIAATVDFAIALPGAQRTNAIVVGQSAGGWGAIAFDSLPHPNVSAVVSMAGGRGGHYNGLANSNCRPDQLAVAAGMLGAGATTPMMWVYTANDSFFDPALASSMYAAFSRAGGKAEFHQLAAFGNDGHGLFLGGGGSAIWGPLMERYLSSR